jgi:hypothetical protein
MTSNELTDSVGHGQCLQDQFTLDGMVFHPKEFLFAELAGFVKYGGWYFELSDVMEQGSELKGEAFLLRKSQPGCHPHAEIPHSVRMTPQGQVPMFQIG